MKGRNRVLGKKGEDIAARFLSRKGYTLISRNVRTYVGEIDIVARKKCMTVFVEIKTRGSLCFGPPYLSVTEKKKKKLIQCALCYLKMKNMSDTPWRIDIISIEIKRFLRFINKVKIEHFEDAIEE
ncbi:MAG: YraN family protein [Omnitrophica bacterium RBG_13_46_9]|nr:MAG: YraN family protein [Omnitrophica bacterium RBG_13_46_9]